VGRPTPAHVALARELLDRIPHRLSEAARSPYSARAVIYALLLNAAGPHRQAQLKRLEEHCEPGMCDETSGLAEEIERLDPASRLPLLDIARSTLTELSPAQFQQFKANIDALIRADQRINLFEWVLGRIVVRYLERHFGQASRPRVNYYSLKPLAGQSAALLSALAYAGQEQGPRATEAFSRAIAHLQLGPLEMLPREQAGLKAVNAALDALNEVAPRFKRMVLMACAESITADGMITPGEAELLRAIAETLDCPIPPVVAGEYARNAGV
jgi:hypothetical protein